MKLVDADNRWSRIAIALVSTTLVYNVLEAVIALWSGARAGSIALVGFVAGFGRQCRTRLVVG